MKKPGIILLCLIIAVGSAPLLALCIQAAPINCPSSMAVACSGQAESAAREVGDNWSFVAVYDRNGVELDSQTMHCQDDDRLDPCDFGPCDDDNPL